MEPVIDIAKYKISARMDELLTLETQLITLLDTGEESFSDELLEKLKGFTEDEQMELCDFWMFSSEVIDFYMIKAGRWEEYSKWMKITQ